MSTEQPQNSQAIFDAAVAESSTGGRQHRRRGGRGRGGGRGRPTADRPDNNVASSTQSEKSTNKNPNGNNGRRRGRGGRNPNEQQPSEAPVSPSTDQALEFIAGSLQDSSAQTMHQQANRTSSNSEQIPTAQSDNAKKKKRRNRNRKRNKASRPWLSAIPPETADPISLDPLEDLPYPPFALVMDEPYTPIYPGMWPPPALETTENNVKEETDLELDREVNILKAQWGDGVVRKEESDTSPNNVKPPPDCLHGRQFYLFDGKVLAYYLTETKQFINPYNRRDLTRPELQALDYYMAVHKLGNAGVVQAYDEKGVTLSTAGVAGQTAEGRAQIMQQEANAIRNTFFQSSAGNEGTSNQVSSARQQPRSRRQQGNISNGRSEPVDGITNELQRLYQNQSNNREDNRPHTDREDESNDLGIYGDEDGGGFLMIDDDINPGLRNGVPSSNPGSSYSARHIAEQQSQQAQAHEQSFPSLSAVTPSTTTGAATTSITQNPTSGPSSKSLKKITKVVKKTNPAELARQKQAREEALRKAELSRLSFFDPTGSNPSIAHNGLLTAPIPAEKLPPTDAILERNRNFANALGVVPAQMRNAPVLTGWARPTTVDIQLDEFGNDINLTQYPESLLAKAKERMTELLKLERTWKKFLADDKEASCSLKPMDRASRVFVHEYSDFWRLSTQSYDPEGRRYIHCSKLLDTSAPHPLLSDAAKRWRGPVSTPGAPPVPYRAPVSAASESSADGWHTKQRKPIKLAPRTIDEGNDPQPDTSSTMGMTRSTSTPLLSMTGEVPAPPRFADLHQERPKLQLAPRTIPSEENQKIVVQNERAMKKEEARINRQQYREKKQKIQEQKKKAILESAFASDDDGVDWSDDSDWFEDDAVFEGSDDEGR